MLLPELAELLGYLVWRAQARVAAALEEVLPESVDLHGYAVLLALAGGVTRSQQELAHTVCVSRTTMVRVGADLADRGLVERVRNPDDRRSYALTRTPDGAAAARAWRRHAEDLEDALTPGFTLVEREELRTSVLRLAEADLAPDTPEPLRESLGFLVTRLQQRMHRDFLAILAPLRIEPRHFGVLTTLHSTGPVSQSELARIVGVSGASMVEMIDDLEARGLVTRRRHESDRRVYVIETTPEADDVRERARVLAATTSQTYLEPLSATQARRLLVLLQRFVTGA